METLFDVIGVLLTGWGILVGIGVLVQFVLAFVIGRQSGLSRKFSTAVAFLFTIIGAAISAVAIWGGIQLTGINNW